MSTILNKSFAEARETPDLWGRFVESCVGTHLINNVPLCDCKLWYWRDGNDEVDFVISRNSEICGIEVKSGSRSKGKGMDSFKKKFPEAKLYVVSENDFPGSACIGLEDFLSMKVDSLF